jgi:hypothetical protein
MIPTRTPGMKKRGVKMRIARNRISNEMVDAAMWPVSEFECFTK